MKLDYECLAFTGINTLKLPERVIIYLEKSQMYRKMPPIKCTLSVQHELTKQVKKNWWIAIHLNSDEQHVQRGGKFRIT